MNRSIALLLALIILASCFNGTIAHSFLRGVGWHAAGKVMRHARF